MEEKVKKTEVVLGKAHTHAGKEHQPGDKITVRESQAKWLQDAGALKDNKAGAAPGSKKEG